MLRYIVTLHPTSAQCKWLKSHSCLLILLTWLIGAVYSLIPLRSIEFVSFKYSNMTHYQCRNPEKLESDHILRVFVIVNFIVTFLIPMATITASYVAIMSQLQRVCSFVAKYPCSSDNNANGNGNNDRPIAHVFVRKVRCDI